jgi:hypothetical protein
LGFFTTLIINEKAKAAVIRSRDIYIYIYIYIYTEKNNPATKPLIRKEEARDSRKRKTILKRNMVTYILLQVVETELLFRRISNVILLIYIKWELKRAKTNPGGEGERCLPS